VARAVTVAGDGTVTEALTVTEVVTEAMALVLAKSVASLLTVTTLARVVGTAVDHAEGYATTASSAEPEEFEPSTKTIGADTGMAATLSARLLFVTAAGSAHL